MHADGELATPTAPAESIGPPLAAGGPCIHGIEDFWARVATSDNVALFLDYDGTLAPFHADRMQALPLEGVVESLLHIINASDTHIFIISGRPTTEILHLAGDLDLTIVGSHGWEMHRPALGRQYVPVTNDQRGILDAAYAYAVGLLGAERVERKVGSVAAHFRGCPHDEIVEFEAALATSWLANAGENVVEYRPFNGGVELRALGRNKGDSVRELLADLPPATLAVYLGDDETDEDAFRQLGDSGIGIKVGNPDAPTAASGRLEAISQVPAFLLHWIETRAAR